MDGQRNAGRTSGRAISKAEAIAFREIRAALGKRRLPEAVRLLLKAVADGVLPRDERIANRILVCQGKRVMLAIIEACAHQPCFYCSKGRDKCDHCAGEGHFEDVEPCRFCLGMGIVRCEFCDGAAWATINTFPPGLRPLIVRRRLQIASARMSELLRSSAAIATGKAKASVKSIYLQIIGLDRQLGVVENAVVALPALTQKSTVLKAPLKKALALAARARERVNKLLFVLGGMHRQPGGIQGGTLLERQRAIKRGELVASMIETKKSLSDTTLGHPFLDRAFARAKASRLKGRPRSGSRRTSGVE